MFRYHLRYIVYAHAQRMTAYVTHHVCTCPAVYANKKKTHMFQYHLRYIVYAHAQRMTAHVLAATTRIKHYGLCVTLDVSKYPKHLQHIWDHCFSSRQSINNEAVQAVSPRSRAHFLAFIAFIAFMALAFMAGLAFLAFMAFMAQPGRKVQLQVSVTLPLFW